MSRDDAYWLSWTAWVFKAFCAAIVVAATFFTVFAVGPQVETWLFPVTDKLRILELRGDRDNRSIVHVEFEKLRPCEFVGIAWFHGDPKLGFMRVPIELRRVTGDTSSPNRPEGLQRSGPWVISVPPDELRVNSFAVLYHRCHPFWLTTTDFFP